jgi:hypothetical protein
MPKIGVEIRAEKLIYEIRTKGLKGAAKIVLVLMGARSQKGKKEKKQGRHH